MVPDENGIESRVHFVNHRCHRPLSTYLSLNQWEMVIGRLESSRVAINCRITSGTDPDGQRSSMKILCRFGKTSVTLSPMSPCNVDAIRGTTSRDR